MWFGPYEHEFLEAGDKIVMNDAQPKPKELRDCLKDQGKELIEVNPGEEGKEAQLIFTSAGLFAGLKHFLIF